MANWGRSGAAKQAEKLGKFGRGGLETARSSDQKIIGVVSGKGGVGKTTTCSNLGTCLQDRGEQVLLIDANTLTSNLGLHLGVVHPQIVLQDVVNKGMDVNRITYVCQNGLHLIPSSVQYGGTIRPEQLKKLLRKVSPNDKTIFIDSSPGLAPEALAVIEACNSLLVVTNPELPAVTDAIKTIDIADKMQKRVLGVVVNKVRGSNYELTKEEIEAACGYPVLAMVPYDESVPASIASKTPVVLYEPESPAAFAFRTLSVKIGGNRLLAEEAGRLTQQYRPGIFKRIWNYFFG